MLFPGRILLPVFVCLFVQSCAALGQTAVEEDARRIDRAHVVRSMKMAARFFRNHVAKHGGYVYYCSEDLQHRWGEGKVTEDVIFVQPPATPSVGDSYLRAYQVTGDSFYLAAATETAEALVAGQLESGGWTQVIHFSIPKRGRLGKYRKRPGGQWNNSSLDDDQTQAALRFLARIDKALDFQHDSIHEATMFGFDALLAAQFEVGGFPQTWTEPVESQPQLKANYPNYDWRTDGRIKDYWNYYTLNDGLAGTVADTLIVGFEIYGDERYMAALLKLGDFLIAAQMPSPQPAWCQQYNFQMQPMWARKFEPPAIAGSESQDVMETLLKIASFTNERKNLSEMGNGALRREEKNLAENRTTGKGPLPSRIDSKYLEALPAAIAYLEEECLLADKKLARYYELRTNRPLYMDADYQLTYDDSGVPPHYGWKVASRLEQIKRQYASVARGRPTFADQPRSPEVATIEKILERMDDRGRWVSEYSGEKLVGQPKFPIGFRYISSEVFTEHFLAMCDFIAN